VPNQAVVEVRDGDHRGDAERGEDRAADGELHRIAGGDV